MGDSKTTRRGLLAGAAAFGGLAGADNDLTPFIRRAKASLVTETAGPIEVAYAEHARLSRASDATGEALEEAEQRFEEVDRPTWHPMRDEGGYTVAQTAPGKGRVCICIGDKNVAELRAIVTAPADPCLPYDPEPRRRRAQATLKKIEAWRAETQRRADEAGLTVAREAHNRATALEKAAAHRVFDLEPTTFREVAFQAAILRHDWFEDRVDKVLDSFVRLAGITPADSGSST